MSDVDVRFEGVSKQYRLGIKRSSSLFWALKDVSLEVERGSSLLAAGIVDGTNASTYEPVLDPQPGWCCVTYRPVPG